jgi:hypothetical protein
MCSQQDKKPMKLLNIGLFIPVCSNNDRENLRKILICLSYSSATVIDDIHGMTKLYVFLRNRQETMCIVLERV